MRSSRILIMVLVLLLPLALSCESETDSGSDGAVGETVAEDRTDIKAVDAEVIHAIGGYSSRLITDVSYDVDQGRSFDIDYTRYLIEEAPTLATSNSPKNEGQLGGEIYLEPAFERFHYWPNVLDLTEIFYGDEALYAEIVAQILERDPKAEDHRSALKTQVEAGERVFLIRDFLNKVMVGEIAYYEVHYAFLVNLDSRTTAELLAHRQGEQGLGQLHDPLVDALTVLFETDGLAEGEVWHMCLRGNLNRHVHNAVRVDWLSMSDGDRFWIKKMHANCGTSLEPDDPPPLEVVIPPPYKPKDPPPEKKVPPKKENPKAPKEEKVEPPKEEQGGECEKQVPPLTCQQELAKAKQMLAAAEQSKSFVQQTLNEDIENYNKLTHGWVDGLKFNNGCLQQAYDDDSQLIEMIRNDIKTVESEMQQAIDQAKEARDGASVAVRVLRSRGGLWDNMVFTPGPWSNVTLTWVVAAFGSGSPGITVFSEAQVHAFHLAVVRAIINDGLTWDEAVKVALNTPAIYPYKPAKDGFVHDYSQDKDIQAAWVAYALCLKELYKKQFDVYLSTWLSDATDAEKAHVFEVLIEGESALTTQEKEENDAIDEVYAERDQATEMLATELKMLNEQLDAVRFKFLDDVNDVCIAEGKNDFYTQSDTVRILQGFVTECETQIEAKVYYGNLNRFCATLKAMLADPAIQNCPNLKAYLQSLLDGTCPGG